MTRTYERIGTYELNEVLPYITEVTGEKYCAFEGHLVKMTSLRYQTFARNHKCVACGLEGAYMALERPTHGNTERYHFNLYSTVDDEEVMLTKDHVHPVSKGGTDDLDNLQTMCSLCNSIKQHDTDIDLEEICHRAKLMRRYAQLAVARKRRSSLDTFRMRFGEDKTSDDFEVFSKQLLTESYIVKALKKGKQVVYLDRVFAVINPEKETVHQLVLE